MQELIWESKYWECSSLIIDYIKIYELDHSEYVNNIQILNKSHDIRASDICRKVSSDLGRKIKSKPSRTFGIAVIFVCLAILVLIMTLAIVIWLVFMHKKKLPTDQAPNEEIYDDNFEKEDFYEEYIYSNQYETVNYEQVQTAHEYLQMEVSVN